MRGGPSKYANYMVSSKYHFKISNNGSGYYLGLESIYTSSLYTVSDRKSIHLDQMTNYQFQIFYKLFIGQLRHGLLISKRLQSLIAL